MFKLFDNTFKEKKSNYSDFFLKMNPNTIINEKISYDKIIKYTISDISYELLDYDKKEPSREIFHIFENISKFSDKLLVKNLDIQMDLFILNSGFVGREFYKTCSFSNMKQDVSKKVLFEVISGEGYILIQDLCENAETEIDIIKIKEKDFILVEKEKCFTIINTLKENKLVLISLKEKDSIFNSTVLKKTHGNLLYYTKSGFIKNNNALGGYNLDDYAGNYIENLYFDKKLGLYNEFISLPEKFNFLKE